MSSPMEEAVIKITKSQAIVSEFLKSHGHEQPSFSAGGALRFPADAPERVNEARYTIAAAARDLQLLALYPFEAMNAISMEACEPVSLQMICAYNIADHVPLDGTISYAELSTKTGISEQRLMRVLRHAMLSHIFTEPVPSRIAHTSLSASLVTSKEIRAVCYWMMHAYDMVPSICKTMNTYGAQQVERSNIKPINIYYGLDPEKNAFQETMKAHPEDFKMFAEAMKASAEGTSPEQVAGGYDWKALGSGTVVDVGGSLGHIGIAIAKSAPNLQVVVQDVGGAVEQGRLQLDPALKSRVRFTELDFFNTNPIKNADVYFFSRVLHDWSDDDSVLILRAAVEVMGPTSKIVICEKVMPEPGEILPYREKMMRGYDLIMMMLNGTERSLEQWKDLVNRADERLTITKIQRPEGSLASLIEVSWSK